MREVVIHGRLKGGRWGAAVNPRFLGLVFLRSFYFNVVISSQAQSRPRGDGREGRRRGERGENKERGGEKGLVA